MLLRGILIFRQTSCSGRFVSCLSHVDTKTNKSCFFVVQVAPDTRPRPRLSSPLSAASLWLTTDSAKPDFLSNGGCPGAGLICASFTWIERLLSVTLSGYGAVHYQFHDHDCLPCHAINLLLIYQILTTKKMARNCMYLKRFRLALYWI